MCCLGGNCMVFHSVLHCITMFLRFSGDRVSVYTVCGELILKSEMQSLVRRALTAFKCLIHAHPFYTSKIFISNSLSYKTKQMCAP